MSPYEILSQIAKNNKEEQGAIEGYFLLLQSIKETGLPMEFYKQVEEIISDEMNHSEVLSEWTTKLSSIKPNET